LARSVSPLRIGDADFHDIDPRRRASDPECCITIHNLTFTPEHNGPGREPSAGDPLAPSIRVANAPCSWGWGVLETAVASPSIRTPPRQVLQEMSAAGYAGTELGDWGFLPDRPDALAAELVGACALDLVGAFVPVALARADALHEGTERAVRTARLLSESVGQTPLIVLSDDNATVPHRTAHAGRIGSDEGLSADEWDAFAARAEHVARQVREATGLRTAFHHHCAGYVETPDELHALMSRTDPTLLGLCLDTGHLVFAGGDPVDAIRRYRDRLWHVHFKDCDRDVARRAAAEQWDYRTSVRNGIFCELGRGAVRFDRVVDELRACGYKGWIVVEQDVLPGLGAPAESARRNRDFLRTLGL
jgi:inosose dehydratase